MHPEPNLQGMIERWQDMLDINVVATLEGCQAAVEVIRGYGKPRHLINLGSLQVRFEAPGVYGATKLAIEAIGATLREELEQDDIRIASIILGGLATGLARGFMPAQRPRSRRIFPARELTPGDSGTQRLIGEARHIAKLVRYILEQPIYLNIQEVLIRPPVSMEA